jgi:galactokinase
VGELCQSGIPGERIIDTFHELTGCKGVLEKYFPAGSSDTPVGMEALFTSNIPAGSGVSSSAALIVASTLAFLVVNGKLSSVTKGDLIGMSILNEKKVGVHSGGFVFQSLRKYSVLM